MPEPEATEEQEPFVPRYTVAKAAHVGGDPIPEGEPCLVIRGQDELALDILNYYQLRYEKHPLHDPAVLDDLVRHRQAIFDWQQEHQPKLADR